MTAFRRACQVFLVLLIATAFTIEGALAQEADREVVRIEAEPTETAVEVGETIDFEARAYDAAGNEVDEAQFRVRAPRAAVEASVDDGTITGLQAGSYQVTVSLFETPNVVWAGDGSPVARIDLTVERPPIEAVDIAADPGQLYVGTTIGHETTPRYPEGSVPDEYAVQWSSSDEDVATVDRFGNVTAHSTGPVTITAEVREGAGEVTYEVEEFPAETLEITGGAEEARTGDVLDFGVEAHDGDGNAIEDVPVTWATTFVPSDSVGAHAGASGQVEDGRFVAELPGVYTVVAAAGPLNARQVVDVQSRDVVQGVREVGHGRVNHKHTSDFWVYEGQDGRDYGITGTWGADGYAYFWDINDPSDPVKYDSIQVDARTINDVKVSPDSRYAALSREGASDRRNGVIIIDLDDPQNPEIASTYTEGLTGGVHNVFPTEDYLYALSAGEKFVILDVRDIENPEYTGEYQHPNARIHDVHVEDGIAYASQWEQGVVIVDVGHGEWGGTPEDPVFIDNFSTPGGRTHAAFPYHSESTDRFYLFLGDEILHREGRALGAGQDRTLHVQPYNPETDEGGKPSHSAGYIHIVDYTGFEDPELVARYEVPEYGTHNMWVKDDILYQAYYEGGARMVDVSGELKGNLADQDREIAVFKPFDPAG